MSLHFNSLFEQLNYCSNSHTVSISPAKTAKEESTSGLNLNIQTQKTAKWSFRSNRKEPGKQETIEEFTKMVKLFAPNTENPIVAKVLDELQELKVKNLWLTAGKIRSVYRRLVSTKVSGARQVAALSELSDRVIWDGTAYKVQNVIFSSLRRKCKEENRLTLDQFYATLIEEWGEKRVDRSLGHMEVDFAKMARKGTPLTVKTINKIMVGLADYRKEDLEQCYKNILEGGAKLAAREKRAFKDHFKVETDDELYEKLALFFGPHKDKAFKELPKEHCILIEKGVFLTAEELELAFNGRRDEGMAKGTIGMGSIQQFFRNLFYSRFHENQTRMELYLKLLRLKQIAPKETLEKSYDELLVKGVVKKELEEGMMIPAPSLNSKQGDGDHTWYRVEKKIFTARGKLAYHLVPDDKNNELDEILMYRSTSSSPAYVDAITTFITDVCPVLPPGYLWKKKGDKEERKVLHSSKRPLRIIGHSLGGIHSQFAICHRTLGKKNTLIDDLPNRQMKVRIFDSPAISKKDARQFAKWTEAPKYAEKAKKLSFELYFSNRDAFPAGGNHHLGFGAKKENLESYSAHYLTPINQNKGQLKLHPHEMQYFQTIPEVDYKSEEVSIESFDKKIWRICMEIIRKISGAFLFMMAVPCMLLSRCFVGIRGRPSAIVRAFKKFHPKNRKIATSE